MSQATSYVYIVGGVTSTACVPHVFKIGIAADVKRRVKELQTSSPCRLEVVAHFPMESVEQAREIEHRLHRLYSERQAEGEWFEFLEGTDMEVELEFISRLVGNWTQGRELSEEELNTLWAEAARDVNAERPLPDDLYLKALRQHPGILTQRPLSPEELRAKVETVFTRLDPPKPQPGDRLVQQIVDHARTWTEGEETNTTLAA